MYDAIIVGGSYAGMAAAMPLVRARRKVAIIDAGERRNRFASHAHGVLALDGKPPGEIAGQAKAQLLAYPTLSWIEGRVQIAAKQGEHFVVSTQAGDHLEARRLVLATGVRDQLPPVPGLAERWGSLVFHCPYCHGYELGGGRVGVLASSEMSLHQALMLPDWGPTSLFLNGAFEPDEQQLMQLKTRGVALERQAVVRLAGQREAVLTLADGREETLAGLFVAPVIVQSGDIARQLGCEIIEGPIAPAVATDEMKQTSVTNVFACGDMARPVGNVTFAMADGATAGLGVHRSLMFEGLSG